jgi:predicted DCC family thiol-disulfide oxidoreductase YuxK
MKIITIFYDNWCPNCTKFVKIIKKIDWLRQIEIKQLRNELDTNPFCNIDLELSKKQMASFTNKFHYGYNSLYYIFIRIPILWLFIPLLYFMKITTIGQYLYIHLALKRKIIPLHCNTNSCQI